MAVASLLRGVALAAATLAAGSAFAQVLSPADSASAPGALTFSPHLPDSGAPLVPQDAGLAPLRPNQTLTTDALLGYVNSQPIFVQDLFRPIDDNLRRLASSSRNLPDFRNKAKELIQRQMGTLVSEILIVSAAQNTLSDNDKQTMDRYLMTRRINLISAHGGSEAMADKALTAAGSSVEKAMDDIKRQFIVQMWIARNLVPKIVVTRQNVIDAYNRDPKRWQEETQVELYTLTLPVQRWLPRQPTTDGTRGDPIAHPSADQVASAESQALAAARDIVAQLKKGADFAKMVEDKDSRDWAARKGGRTADVKKGTLTNPKLENYVFSLPANTIGEPQLFRDANPLLSTVVIVKIGDKKEGRVIPFSEAQATIYEELRNSQLDGLKKEYMEKLYYTGAVEKIEGNVDLAVDAAVARYAAQ